MVIVKSIEGLLVRRLVKFFDLAVGTTGLSAKMLERLQIPYKEVIIHGACHAGYYPGAVMMTVKIISLRSMENY